MSKIICEDCPVRSNCDVVPYDVECDKRRADYMTTHGHNIMNIEVNFDNLTKEEQAQFNALVEKANKPKNKVWKPEIGERYYCISAGAGIRDFMYNALCDTVNYVIGNCFETKEEAEFALERLKVIAEMKRYIAEHDDVEPDWGDYYQLKWYILYRHDTGCIDTADCTHTQAIDNSLYAYSAETLENMIEEIGEDRIKKYYFGVK